MGQFKGPVTAGDLLTIAAGSAGKVARGVMIASKVYTETSGVFMETK